MSRSCNRVPDRCGGGEPSIRFKFEKRYLGQKIWWKMRKSWSEAPTHSKSFSCTEQTRQLIPAYFSCFFSYRQTSSSFHFVVIVFNGGGIIIIMIYERKWTAVGCAVFPPHASLTSRIKAVVAEKEIRWERSLPIDSWLTHHLSTFLE